MCLDSEVDLESVGGDDVRSGGERTSCASGGGFELLLGGGEEGGERRADFGEEGGERRAGSVGEGVSCSFFAVLSSLVFFLARKPRQYA